METKPLSVKDSAYSYVSSFILSQLTLVFYALIGILICRFNGYDSNAFYNFTKQDFGYLLSVIVMNFVLLAVSLFFEHKKSDKLVGKVKFSKLMIYLTIAVASYFVLYPVVVSFNQLFKVKSTALELSTAGYIYSVFSRVLIPAICEEILFRGIIFKGIANTNKTLAIFMSAIMFAIFHMSAEQFIYPLLMGLLFGVIMAYENNIIYCIVVHIINNSLALCGLGYFFNHWTYYLLAAIMFLLFVGCVLFFALRKIDKTKLTKQDSLAIIISIAIMLVFWILVMIVNK